MRRGIRIGWGASGGDPFRRWTRGIGVTMLIMAMVLLAVPLVRAAPVIDREQHAEVIAQGVAQLPASPAAWRVTSGDARTGNDAATDQRPLGCVFVPNGDVLVRNADTGNQEMLADGEAAFEANGTNQYRQSRDRDPVRTLGLELVDPSEVHDVVGNDQYLTDSGSFEIPSGLHDINLIRDVIEPSYQTSLPEPRPRSTSMSRTGR